MSVIEAPVRERTTVTIEPTWQQHALQKMIRMVEAGQWCRDTVLDARQRHCALGMAGMVTGEGPCTFGSKAQEIIALLDRAIPSEDVERLNRIPRHAIVNGGTMRTMMYPPGRVASYNNTIKSEREIIAWYERALKLTF